MCSLRVRFSQNYEIRGIYTYALKVEVIDSNGIPKKIFVYHQIPPGLDGNMNSEFDHIATPVDFQEIPEDAATEIVPWYRTDRCTVWLRSVADLKMAKQLFVDDISELQKTYGILTSDDNFTEQTTVDFSDEGIHGDGGKDSGEDSGDGGILDGVEIHANTADGMREAVETIGEALGATVVK